MMRASLACTLTAFLFVGGAAHASTPDDAWVAKFVDRVTNPAVYQVTPHTIERYFDGVLHLRAMGSDACPRSFQATDKWPTLNTSWFSFAKAETCDASPLANVNVNFLGDDAPEVEPLLEALRKRLGKPSREDVIPETKVAHTMWGTRTHGVGVEYDAGNPRGYTVWIFGPASASGRL